MAKSDLVTRIIRTKELSQLLDVHSTVIGTGLQANIYICFDTQAITLSTNNLGVMRVSSLPIGGEDIAMALIDCKRFREVISLLRSSEKVKVTIDRKSDTVFINDDQVRMSGIDPDNYTTIPKCPEARWTIPDGSLLSDVIERCTISMDSSRPTLDGVCLVGSGVSFTVFSTDGITTTVDSSLALEGEGENFRVFVNSHHVNAFTNLPAGPIKMSVTNEKVFLKYPNGYTTIRLSEVKDFPDEKILKFIPTKETVFAGHITMERSAFEMALNLVKTTGNTFVKDGHVHKSTIIKATLLFKDEKIEIASFGGGQEHGAKTIIGYQGYGEGRMIINLMAVPSIDLLKKSGRITFGYQDNKAPYVITSDLIPGYTTLLVPITTTDERG